MCLVSRRSHPKVYLALSALGVLTGLIGFIVSVSYGKCDLGFWFVLAIALAAVCAHLHWVRLRNTLEVWHTTRTLRNLCHTGFVSGVVFHAVTIWYFFLRFYHYDPDATFAENKAALAVGPWFCGCWGFALMTVSHVYEAIIRDGPSSMLNQEGA